MRNTTTVFVVGLMAVMMMGIVSVPVSAQDNSKPGSFGVGATVSVQVDRATNAQPTVLAPIETSLPYIAAGFVIGVVVASLFALLLMKSRRQKQPRLAVR